MNEIKTIYPVKVLRGEITVPGDKSISHRAVMFGALAEGMTEINGFLTGEDCLSTIDCFRRMGIDIQLDLEKKQVVVYGKGLTGLKEPNELLYTGNSGTTTRLLLGILSGQSFESTLNGDDSIQRRPMKRVTVPLRSMGAKIEGRDDANFCPLIVKPSRLEGITYTLPVASAQVKTALILAGLYAQGQTEIIEPVQSRNHTELMLSAFGAELKTSTPSDIQQDSRIYVNNTGKLYGQKIMVPGDISAAAFFITAGLIVPGAELIIRNVGINPTRTGILDVYQAMGGNFQLFNQRIQGGEPVADLVVKHSSLRATTLEGSLIPRLIDEIPVIAVAACLAEGTTVIRNAEELKVKESDRITVVVNELTKLGASIEATQDGMIIHGSRNKSFNGGRVLSHADHRIAMSLAVAGLTADEPVEIENPGAVDISFPGFFDQLSKLNR